jgi:hypothetical protein
MEPLIFEDISSTTKPFELDVGNYSVAVTGDFGGGAAVLARQVPVHDGREIYDHINGLPVFSAKVGTGEFNVRPNGVGLYRLSVTPGATPTKLTLAITLSEG